MDSTEESLFEQALTRYQEGADPKEILNDFISITTRSPSHSAGWTCLAWLQLLTENPNEALRSARIAVKLNSQDPQARVNLSLALLETNSKGVREQIEVVKKILFTVPEFEKDLKGSIKDGLNRKPGWEALEKIKKWLEL